MNLKRVLLSGAVATIISAAAPVFAADYQLDGKLPMYPNGKLDARESSLTPDAIAHGVPLVLLTSDSVANVKTWYESHLPKACSRQEASGGVKFACAGGSIMVYAHDGKTQIAFVPPFPSLNG